MILVHARPPRPLTSDPHSRDRCILVLISCHSIVLSVCVFAKEAIALRRLSVFSQEGRLLIGNVKSCLRSVKLEESRPHKAFTYLTRWGSRLLWKNDAPPPATLLRRPSPLRNSRPWCMRQPSTASIEIPHHCI